MMELTDEMRKEIRVEIYQAYLVIEEKKVKLTRSLARQIPVMDVNYRWDKGVAGEPVEEPICKIQGETIDKGYYWLYLCQHPEAGLVWQPAFALQDKWRQTVRDKGGWVDCPEEVPTVLL